MIADSLREVGAARSIVIDEDGNILAGNGTVRAAKEAGITNLHVVDVEGDTLVAVRRSGLTQEEKTRLAIADNRTAELAEWDEEVLKGFVDEGFNFEGLWQDGELEALLASVNAEPVGLLPEADPDAVPDNVETRCKTGDLWKLGPHRLLCGDSTVATDVERALASPPTIVFTSPPYSNQRDYEIGYFDWDDLMQGVFANVPQGDAIQVFVNLGLKHDKGEWQPYYDGWIEWMRSIGWRRFGMYIWNQGEGLPGDWNGRFAPCFEFVFHFNIGAKQPNKILDTLEESQKPRTRTGSLRLEDGTVDKVNSPELCGQTTKIPNAVISMSREKARGIHTQNHPAVFPVAFPAFMMEAYTQANESVYDPFLGSGTTLIAAESLGRTCYGIEISPKYCDVILQRWENATGKKAVLDVQE